MIKQSFLEMLAAVGTFAGPMLLAWLKTAKDVKKGARKAEALAMRLEESFGQLDNMSAVLSENGLKINGRLAQLIEAEAEKRFLEGKEVGRQQAHAELADHTAKAAEAASKILSSAATSAEAAAKAAQRVAESVEKASAAQAHSDVKEMLAAVPPNSRPQKPMEPTT